MTIKLKLSQFVIHLHLPEFWCRSIQQVATCVLTLWLGFSQVFASPPKFFFFRDNYNTLLIPQLEPFLFRPLSTLCIERCQFNYKVFGSPTKLNLPSLLQSSKNKLKHRLVRSISSACLIGLEPIITKMKITHTSVFTFFIKYILISFFLYIPISFIIVLARISGFVSCQMIHEIRCGKQFWIGGEEMREGVEI